MRVQLTCRWAGVLHLLSASAVLLAACQPATPSATSKPTPASGAAAGGEASAWSDLVAAAQREGTVVVYGPPGSPYRPALVTAFEQAHPGIKVQASFADVNTKFAQIGTERAAGQFIPDVWISGTTPTVTGMKEAGYTAPLPPALVLAEVTDEKAWLGGRLAWADSAEPYTTLMFQGGVNNVVFYNTKMVDPSQFTSYYDLLDPKWKGKIVATDIRRPGPGGVPSRFIYKEPSLGPEFLGRLFGETDITLSSNQQQMIDWVAQGQYALGLFLSDAEVAKAAQQGLPIASVPAERFKEGASIGPGYGAVAMLDRAPHPNAAKVYINWLLSKDGQTAWQREVESPSLRIDIPKDSLPQSQVPKSGVRYVNAGTEEYSRLTPTAIADIITQGLKKAGRE